MNGRITRYFDNKGYGFIRGTDGEDYFFHISNILSGSPAQGMQVNFTAAENDKGNVAENVDLVMAAPVINGGAETLAAYAKSSVTRGFRFLAEGKSDRAEMYFERALDSDPDCGEAYLGKLLIYFGLRRREQLRDLPQPFQNVKLFHDCMHYGDAQLKNELKGYNDYIRMRNNAAAEQERREQAEREAAAERRAREEARRAKQNYIQNIRGQIESLENQLREANKHFSLHKKKEMAAIQSRIDALETQLYTARVELNNI